MSEAPAIAGYRLLPPEAIESVNASKQIEEHVLRLLDEFGEDAALAVEKRWLSIGRTQIEQGFMAVNRAIMKPERVSIPDEDEPIVETGWVLERADSDPAAPLFYAPWAGGEQWSKDERQALRLMREEDASRLAVSIGVQTRVCEHLWS